MTLLERKVVTDRLPQDVKDILTCGICYFFVTEEKTPLECNSCHN